MWPSRRRTGDETQARAFFAKIKAMLEAAGRQMADVVEMTVCYVVETTVYVTGIRRRVRVWKAGREF